MRSRLTYGNIIIKSQVSRLLSVGNGRNSMEMMRSIIINEVTKYLVNSSDLPFRRYNVSPLYRTQECSYLPHGITATYCISKIEWDERQQQTLGLQHSRIVYRNRECLKFPFGPQSRAAWDVKSVPGLSGGWFDSFYSIWGVLLTFSIHESPRQRVFSLSPGRNPCASS